MVVQSLALKYRPQTFDDVIGQETTVQILKNCITEGRVHNAYLLTGPRGTGKTSLARIFAKSLNCGKGEKPTVAPCGSCPSCIEIAESRSLAVLEIDGASNTSVEDVRDLRERIRYLPPGGRYKIYIIDEVHMLSTAAFNALLKTLEEPPPHALFVFATTEPHKVPATIVSRCLRFDLRPIPSPQIVERLRFIAEREAIQSDQPVLFEIARESLGGLRDAVGLLDQASSFSGKNLDLKMIELVIGSSPRRFVREIASAILAQDPVTLLSHLKGAGEAGLEPKRIALALLEYLRHLLVVRVSDDPLLFDLPPDEIATLKETSRSVSEDSLDQLFRLLQRGIPDLLRSSLPQILLDVLLLRLCHYREIQSVETLLQKLDGMEEDSPLPKKDFKEAPLFNPVKKVTPVPPAPVSSTEAKGWPEFLHRLREIRPQLSSILEQGSSADLADDQVTVSFPTGSIHLEMIKERERRGQLEAELQRFFGRPLALRLSERTVPLGPAPLGGAPSSSLIEEAVSIFHPVSMKSVS